MDFLRTIQKIPGSNKSKFRQFPINRVPTAAQSDGIPLLPGTAAGDSKRIAQPERDAIAGATALKLEWPKKQVVEGKLNWLNKITFSLVIFT